MQGEGEKQQPLPSPGEGGNVHCLLLHEMPAWAVKETAMLLNREWPRSLSARMQSIQASPSLSIFPFLSGFWMSMLHLQTMPQFILNLMPPMVLGGLPCSCSFSRTGSNRICHHLFGGHICGPLLAFFTWLLRRPQQIARLATPFVMYKKMILLGIHREIIQLMRGFQKIHLFDRAIAHDSIVAVGDFPCV